MQGSPAKFPGLDTGAGGYESFYLKACHPAEPLGLWIRYTVHKRPGERPKGSLWCTLFDQGQPPRAVKQTVPEPRAESGRYIAIGDSRFAADEVVGAASAQGREASWDLRLSGGEQPMRHLPRRWMYRAPVPRTKLLTPHPGVRFDGRATVDGREASIDGWRGMVGHNWGAEHAERWIWLHGLGFDGEPETTWLDVAIGRIKLGPLTTPWVANGVLSLDGVRHAVGGVERVRSTEVDEAPDRCTFRLPGRGLSVRGTVRAPRSSFVGWVYADPDGSEHHTVNCSVADMDLDVEADGRPPRRLTLSGGAAYELGMRERDHGMDIQPFPDG